DRLGKDPEQGCRQGLVFDLHGFLWIRVIAFMQVVGQVQLPATQATPARALVGLDHPRGVTIDSARRVYVTNFGSGAGTGTTVSVFDPGATGANPARTLTGLNGPSGIAIDSTSHIYVTNYGGGGGTTVSVFDPGATTANPAKTLTGLAGPTGVAIDSAHRVYVSNYAAGSGSTVSVFEPGATTANSARELTGVTGPFGVTVDSANTVYVSNHGAGGAGSTVSVYDPLVSRPGKVTSLKIKVRKAGVARISWAPTTATGEVPTYLVQALRAGRLWRTVTITSTVSFVGKIPYAKPGRRLYFRVIALTSVGPGPASVTKSAVMK
ncbi:MAG: hypothetical protein WCI74_13450, partial [Actinomycetes bacterium]